MVGVEMKQSQLSRRGVLAGLSGAALAGPTAATAATTFLTPDGACDCHLHIYDPRFAYQPDAQLKPPPSTVADYRAVQRRLGVSRAVIVTPSTYGTDNAHLVDALGQIGEAARGVAVCHADVSMRELRRLHEAGVRGVRVQFGRGSLIAVEEIMPLARKVAPLGWHVQFNMPAPDYARIGDLLLRLPGTVVIDHFGHVPMPEGTASAQYRLIRRLLDTGRTWMKLSSPYTDSVTGGPAYADIAALARDYIVHAPERMVWASNWPYPDMLATPPLPDPLAMLDILHSWAPDPFMRHRILVENPEALYGFSPTDRPKATG
jgi:D-galactarolactone isomerase